MRTTLRKLVLIVCLSALVLPAVGCQSPRSSVFAGGYWKRHWYNLLDGLHATRVDIDRIIFDLDDRPIEDY